MYTDLEIIARSFLEQFVYLKFITSRNTEKRSIAYVTHQRYMDLKKIKRIIEFVDSKDKSTLKEKINIKIKENKSGREDFENEYIYWENKYNLLFDQGLSKKRRGNWYNFEEHNNKNKQFGKFMDSLGMKDLYVEVYALLSSNVHGVDAPKNISISNVTNLTADVEISDTFSFDKIQLISELLYESFFMIVKYYNLNKNKRIKGITAKMLINMKLKF